jgi:hypothetical protein
MTTALFGHDAVRGEVGAQPFDDQLFAGAIGLGHQVEIAFELEGDPALKIIGQQGTRLARDFHRCLQVRHALGLFREVLDVVFENKKIGFTFAGQADEGLIVILDDANHFLSVFQPDSDQRRILDQLFEIFCLFKRLFRRARGFSWRWRSGFS